MYKYIILTSTCLCRIGGEKTQSSHTQLPGTQKTASLKTYRFNNILEFKNPWHLKAVPFLNKKGCKPTHFLIWHMYHIQLGACCSGHVILLLEFLDDLPMLPEGSQILKVL